MNQTRIRSGSAPGPAGVCSRRCPRSPVDWRGDILSQFPTVDVHILGAFSVSFLQVTPNWLHVLARNFFIIFIEAKDMRRSVTVPQSVPIVDFFSVNMGDNVLFDQNGLACFSYGYWKRRTSINGHFDFGEFLLLLLFRTSSDVMVSRLMTHKQVSLTSPTPACRGAGRRRLLSSELP